MAEIKAGDFVFCLGEGLAIFPVVSVDKRNNSAYLNPSIGGEGGIGGNEELHKLQLVRDSDYASDFPQFCIEPGTTFAELVAYLEVVMCDICNVACQPTEKGETCPICGMVVEE